VVKTATSWKIANALHLNNNLADKNSMMHVIIIKFN